jgi:glycosyltransferase involved in cell wall biosynthesis
MNVLMLGLGDPDLADPSSESVRRHLEYARRAGGHVDLIVDSPDVGSSDFGALTVWRTGARRAFFPLAAGRLAREAARRNAPDLITTQDPFATGLAGIGTRRALRKPLLIQNHSCFLFNRYWIAERPAAFRALHLLARLVLPRADAWRVVNTAERRIYIERLGLPADRVKVLPVPCDLECFTDDRMPSAVRRARERAPFSSGRPVLLWAGRPVRFKRLPLLFEAFAIVRSSIPEARLVVVGRKSLAQEDLQRVARATKIEDSLAWIEDIDRADLAGIFGAADVFLFPSIYEGFGRVLVEAGAAGLPAVATATAGARDILVDGETGLLAPIEDAAAIADRALALLADPALRKRMGVAAKARVRDRFEPARMFEGVVGQWREVAAGGIR